MFLAYWVTRSARRWYDIQSDFALESWNSLIVKQEIIKMFNQTLLYGNAKIEVRKWNFTKETFDQYAIDKLALMYWLNLPHPDVINLLIGGIMKSSLRATALTLSPDTFDQFLCKMRQITERIGELDKRTAQQQRMINNKPKDLLCKNCGRKGHNYRDCRDPDLLCFYCKEKGHRKMDCPKLQRKDRKKRAKKPPWRLQILLWDTSVVRSIGSPDADSY